jgi:hypothetical protein
MFKGLASYTPSRDGQAIEKLPRETIDMLAELKQENRGVADFAGAP